MEIIKDENGQEVIIVRNKSGRIIARMHGGLDIDILAKFMIKNIKRTPKA